MLGLGLISGGIFAVSQMKAPITKEVQAASKGAAYEGTVYVAGMGGHFAKVQLMIDPKDSENPIKVKDLDRVVIGTKADHPTHDPRIDVTNPNLLFWSTYVYDQNKNFHVGVTDLKTGEVIKDVAVPSDPRAPKDKPGYCASGQTNEYYLPVMMQPDAFVDVFTKKDLKHVRRMYISELGFKPGTYMFLHGVNSNDQKKFLLTISEPTGKMHFVMVDLPALIEGKWKVLKKKTHTGEPKKTITFRLYFTPDDKYVFAAAADRVWVLDANTLELVDEKIINGQAHDFMPTPDGKYGIITIRNLAYKPKTEDSYTDGFIQLYDFTQKRVIGKQVSVCGACHSQFGMYKSAALCGIDGRLKIVK